MFQQTSIFTRVYGVHLSNQDVYIHIAFLPEELSRSSYLQLPIVIFSSNSYFNSDFAIQEMSVYPERGLIFDRNGQLLVANQPMYDLIIIPENTIEFDTIELSNLIGIEKKELKRKISNSVNYSTKIPSIIKTQISKEENAFLQEKIWLYDGFYLKKNSVRDYIKPFASNLIGYTGEVDQTEINTDNYYEKGEMIGKQGIEKYYEKELRGIKGIKYFQKDRFNRVIGPYNNSDDNEDPTKAKNITLTIDIELQKYAESLLKNKKGGVVVIEPSTGEILTLVSAPTYESNQFIGQGRTNNFQKLLNDSINKPLFDRSLQAQYSPGSPMKILNALIGLQEDVIDENTTFTCNGGHYYAKNAFMGCHNKVGTISDLRKGIYNSCNTYFAKTYKMILDKYETPSEGLDSWANVHLIHQKARHCTYTDTLSLAHGGTKCYRSTGRKGVPIVMVPWIEDGDNIDLLPESFLLKRGCELTKGKDQRLTTPKGQVIILQIWGDMPYLLKSDLQRVLDDLPDASAPGRDGTMLFEPTAARVCRTEVPMSTTRSHLKHLREHMSKPKLSRRV